MKPRLLFLTPVVPKSDKGVRKRCLMHLSNLQQLFDVDTLVISRSTAQTLEDITPEEEIFNQGDFVQYYVGHGNAYTQLRNANRSNNRLIRFFWKLFCDPLNSKSFDSVETRDLLQIIEGRQYDMIFAFRISMGRAAQAIVNSSPSLNSIPKVVDFDDIESKAKRREASNVRETEGRLNSLFHRIQAHKIFKLETKQLDTFSQVYVCSENDKAELVKRDSSKLDRKVRVIPNALDLPLHEISQSRQPLGEQTLKLLFVGTMDHGPNLDAIHYIVEQIYPSLQERLADRFEINIVGRYPTKEVLAYDKRPRINIHPDVPNIGEFYHSTDIVLAPIRYGGGTKLKILEAFAYGKPVLSTTIGAEGIAATDRKDILIANTPDEYVQRCEEILADPVLPLEIAKNAQQLYSNTYTYGASLKHLTDHLHELGF